MPAPDEKTQPPGPRFLTPYGFFAALRRDPLAFLADAWRQHGDTLRVRAFPLQTYVFTHPRDVKYVLRDNHRNYWKGSLFGKLKRVAGEGLVFSDGDLWRRQRQLVQPAFQRDRIAALVPMMTDCCERMLDRWTPHAIAGRPVELAGEMSLLALEIAARALFGTDLGEDRERFRRAVEGGLAYANHLATHFATPPLRVPTPANLRARRVLAELDDVLWRVIDSHRRDGTDRGDLLCMLIAARDAETDEAMDDQQLRDECVTFLVAGHETTGMALAWAWHLLSGHPSCERRLHEEVSGVLGDRPPTLADLPALPYTRMVFEESMRLYPPVWALARESYVEDRVGDVPIPGRTVVTLSPYLTHRHPEFWDHPEGFDPERFAPERSADRPEHAYLPFGAGPRKCIGSQLAMLEGQIALAMTAQRFALESVPGHRVEPHPVLTLKPRDGVWMKLVPRG